MHILLPKKEQRRHYWQEIKKTVRTHEGELLTGSKGRDYQQKYSKKYLGKDLSGPVDCHGSDYDRVLDKTTR
jgi:hypothetical protein